MKRRLQGASKIGSRQSIASIHIELGEFYRKSGLYSQAMDEYNQAQFYLESDAKDTLQVQLNKAIGNVYLSMHRFEEAKKNFNESITVSDQLNDPKGKAIALGLLGSCFEKQSKYEQALTYQKQSLQLFEALNDAQGVSIINENIGSIYEDLGELDLAYEYFSKSYQYLNGMNNAQEANVLNNLGDVYRRKGNIPLALEYTGKALEVATNIVDLHQLERANRDMAKAFALQNDFEKAFYYQKEAEANNKTLLQHQDTDRLSVLQTIYESNKKEGEIKLLREQNKVVKANQRLLVLAMIAVLLVLGGIYFQINRKKKEKLKLEEYKQRMLKAELDKKVFEEKNLQREVQMKTAALSRYSLHLSQKNKILEELSKTLANIAQRKHMDSGAKIKSIVKEIDFNLRQEDEWDEFNNFFKDIHPDFIKKLSTLSENKLSPAEMRLGMLLRLNLSSKEIASILRVTPDSVRVARYRLRKKLPIHQKEELVNFMVAL
ncbi:MAG: tetratricopeptide repeat protein [Bacteroidota bacterium]